MSEETTLTTTAPTSSAADASVPAAAVVTDAQATAPVPATDAAANQQPSTDKPATQDAPADADKSADDGDKAAKLAPERYEFKAPEGTTLDGELLGEFEGLARELDLSQEAAQKFVDKLAPKMVERFAASQADVVARAQADWAKQAQTDAEIGGDKLNENLAVAKAARDKFGTTAFSELLEQSGLGNHPEVIRMLYRVGKQISQDTVVVGRVGGNLPASRDLATALYS